ERAPPARREPVQEVPIQSRRILERLAISSTGPGTVAPTTEPRPRRRDDLLEDALPERGAVEDGGGRTVVVLVMEKAAIQAGLGAAIGGVGDESGGDVPAVAEE